MYNTLWTVVQSEQAEKKTKKKQDKQFSNRKRLGI